MFTNDWEIILKEEINKDYFKKIKEFIDEEYKNKTIHPDYENIFKAFDLTSYKNTKVVILGQDPYHGTNEADGLAFSVSNNQKTPPSLRNIKKEIENDLGFIRENNNLEDLAKQGVLLLNCLLTVEHKTPLSHQQIGWEIFTNKVIELVSKKDEKVIFVLLGKYAQSKKEFIDENNYIIETTHPSPFSAYRGFNNSKIFSRINKLLEKEIDWSGNYE